MAWLAKFQPYLLSILRIMTGLLFLEHGLQKLFGFPPLPANMAQMIAMMPILKAAAVIELIGGTLLVLGLFTRVVAFVCSGEMAIAYFIGHASRGFFPALNGGDAAILFCFIFLYIAAAGPGPWALSKSDKI